MAFIRAYFGRSVSWVKADDPLIRLEVEASPPISGAEWVKKLREEKYRVTSGAELTLLSSQFRPVQMFRQKLVVVRGSLFKDHERRVSDVLDYAKMRKLIRPHPQVACQLRRQLSDRELAEMDLDWIVIPHEPVVDSSERAENAPEPTDTFLALSRVGEGNVLLRYPATPDTMYESCDGFVFIDPTSF